MKGYIIVFWTLVLSILTVLNEHFINLDNKYMAKNKINKTQVNLPIQQLAKNIFLQVPERLQCLRLRKVWGGDEETLLSILSTDQFFVLLLKAAAHGSDSKGQSQ